MTNYTYVLLAGRTGNQLFQIAAGEYCLLNSRTPNQKLGFIVSKTTPKTFLAINQNIVQVNYLISKLLNYLLSRGVQPRNRWRSILLGAVNSFCKVLLAIKLRSIDIDLQVAKSVNAPPELDAGARKITIYVGYFQNYYWQSLDKEMHKQLSNYVPRCHIRIFPPYEITAASVVVHLRRTDYALNPELGLLSDLFYQTALKDMFRKIEPFDIYIVTDDRKFKAEYFVKQLPVREVFTPERMTDAEAFEFMRRASNLLISNSSFAWWAAYLQYGEDTKRLVVFPSPWFRTLDGLKDFPKPWIGIQSFWVDSL